MKNKEHRQVKRIILYLFAIHTILSQGQTTPPTLDDGSTGGSGTTSESIIDQVSLYNMIPSNPQVSGFDVYGNHNISGASGTPDINILLYTIEEDGVSIPITLSYDATGIKVQDIATEVGLKWRLNVGGSISRTIKGLPDEDANGWLNKVGTPGFPNESWNNSIGCYLQQLEEIDNNLLDVLPDMYAYKLPGYQGSFYYNNEAQLCKTINDDLKFVPVVKWSCVDKLGVVYTFGENNAVSIANVHSNANRGSDVFNPARTSSGINEWKLTSILTKNGKTITLSYNTLNSYSYTTTSAVKRIGQGFPEDPPGTTNTTTNHTSNFSFDNKLIDCINSSHVRVEFEYETDASASVWKKKLTRIKIISKNTGECKSFLFEYDRYNGCAKLRLRKVTELGFDATSSGRVWRFNYNNNPLPLMDSKDIDFFGYYNGAGNGGLIPLTYDENTTSIQNSREVNDDFIANGILNEITYPTGGKTKFYYEANKETVSGKDYYAPGVRLRKMEDYTNNSTPCNVKEFYYSDLTGDIINPDFYYPTTWENIIDQNYNITTMLYSTSKGVLNPKSGYGYKQLETRFYSNNEIVGRNVDYFSFIEAGTIVSPIIDSSYTYDEGSKLLQKTTYKYLPFSESSQNIGWRVVGDYSRPYVQYDCNSNGVTFFIHRIGMGIYKDYIYGSCSAILLNRVIKTNYFSNDSIANEVIYEYNENLQLSSEIQSTSTDNQGTTEYYIKYIEYPSVTSFLELYNKHMIGLPVMVSQYKWNILTTPLGDGGKIPLEEESFKIVNKSKSDFDNNGNPIATYDFVEKSEQNYLELKESYTYYQNGRLKECQHRDGTCTTYLWGYNSQYIIASIENATFNQIEPLLGETFITGISNALIPSSADLQQLNGLRFGLPTAHITTYTYRPLAGVSSVTDPTFYYDSNNPSQKCVIKAYDYRYRSN